METPGSLIDKLFTVDHKLWNQEDIAQTPGADDHTVAEAKRKISKLNLQRNALIQEFDELISDIVLKRKEPPVVPQLKQYGKV
jgi:hypothetical protein